MIILNLSYIIKKEKLHCLNYKYVQILIALYVRFYEEMIVACNIKIEKLKKRKEDERGYSGKIYPLFQLGKQNLHEEA